MGLKARARHQLESYVFDLPECPRAGDADTPRSESDLNTNSYGAATADLFGCAEQAQPGRDSVSDRVGPTTRIGARGLVARCTWTRSPDISLARLRHQRPCTDHTRTVWPCSRPVRGAVAARYLGAEISADIDVTIVNIDS